MNYAELFFAIFNIIVGAMLASIGLRIWDIKRPMTTGMKWFFRLGGMFVLIWGIVSLIRSL